MSIGRTLGIAFVTLTVFATLLGSIAVFSGCKGEPKLEDIEGWIRAGQFSKVKEYVAKEDNPMELRVGALLKLVEYGVVGEVQACLQEVKDSEAVVEATLKTLYAHLENPSAELELQVQAKNTVFAIKSHVSDETMDAALAKIATWAFKGLSENSTEAELAEALSRAQMPEGQIISMKQHGIPMAAWLTSYGLNTMTFAPYLVEANTVENQRIVVRAMRKLLKDDKVRLPWEFIRIAPKLTIPETFDFLVDVYLNPRFDDDQRSSALAVAQLLLLGENKDGVKLDEKVSITDTAEKRKRVLASLKRLMGSTTATDRWDAADAMLVVGGTEELDMVMDGFAADLDSYVYVTQDYEIEMPDILIGDLCNKHLRPKASKTRPVLEKWAGKGNRIQRAISILCLKMLAEPASLDALKPLLTLTTNEHQLENFFFTRDVRKERRPLAEAGTIPVVTVGHLAQNAIDGIELLAQYEKAKQDGKMDEKEAAARAQAVIAIIAFTGDTYKREIERAYLKSIGKEPPKDPEPEKTEAPKAEDAKKDDKKADKKAGKRDRKRGKKGEK